MGSRAVNTASYYIPRFPVRYLLSGGSVTVTGISCVLTTTTTISTTIRCISSSNCSTTTTRAYSYLTSSIRRTATAGAYSYTAVEYEVLSLEEAPVRIRLQVAVDAPFQL